MVDLGNHTICGNRQNFQIYCSDITTMKDMFNGDQTFNEDIRSWDTSTVTTMIGAFGSTPKFNQNICEWDTHIKDPSSRHDCYVSYSISVQSGPFLVVCSSNHIRAYKFC